MKKIKKAVSLILVLSMIIGMTWNVSAEEITQDQQQEEVISQDVVDNTESDTKAEASVDEDIMPASEGEPVAYAGTVGTKPEDGTTSGQPFSSGTGGSTNFRIPALVTLSDGTLVAAADARWNTTADGYGLDTIVSRSSDKGANWKYTFANYLGDNGNVSNNDSTAFIDPALAVTSDDTIYMLVDLYPHGTYIGNVKAGTGFDNNGHLLLRTSSGSSYDYYVGDFNNGTANIYKTDGTQVSDYTVDEYYNIKGTNVDTNLFFSNSPYQVLSTSYLYLTKSTDGGKTWSAPQMLNSQVKNSNDMFYGVGPGRGLVTSTGRIIFPCYTYTTSDGNTSVIYSDDNGKTWTRSKDMTSQSSEAALAEADGNIYMFTRHGGYYVSENNGATWSKQQNVGISYTTSCQLSAITYSKKIDGKTAILLSAPTNGRTTGKIFVGLVQDDGSINWKYTYSVNGSGTYAYSCLTELSDGFIGLLYENGSGSITYTKLAIEEIAAKAEIGESKKTTVKDETTGISATAERLESIAVTKKSNSTPYTGYTASVTYDISLNEGEYKGKAEIKVPYDDTIFAECNEFIGSVGEDTFAVTAKDDYFVGTVPHFSDVTISGRATQPTTQDITLYVGQTKTITDSTGEYNSCANGPDSDIANVELKPSSLADNGKVTTSTMNGIVSGSTYVLQNVRSSIFLVNTAYNGNTLATTGTADNIGTLANHKWTITAVDGGYYVQDSNGKYLTIGNGTSRVTDTPTVLSLAYNTVTAAPNTWTIGEGSYYLNNPASSKVNAAGWTGKDNGSCWNIYPVAATDITISGVAAGTTSVVVGNTLYNITVKDIPDIVDMETTPFVANSGVGEGKKITKLTTSVGLTFDVDLDTTGNNVEWSVADSSIATVDQNGKVTGVKAGETTVMATIDGVVYTLPVVIRQDTTYSNTKIYDFYLSEVTDTTVYYSVSMSTDLVEAQEGEAIYISCGSTDDTAVDFFAKPNDGYALTRMSSTNSAGDYMALNSDTPSKTDFCTKSGAAGSNQINTFGSGAVYAMVQAALDKDCDGGMGWTRPSSNPNGVTSDLTFRSEKLPTVMKEVATVNGEPYEEGMVAHVGEKVVFNVTVTQYAAQDSIDYSNASLKDNLSGAKFSGTSSDTQTVSGLSNTALSVNKEITYQVEYIITDTDLDKTIVNTVDLTYTYKSQYSSGSFGGTANADAKFTAASFTPDDIVVDFGLPVVIDYSGGDAHGRYDLSSGTASYGDVTVSDNKVTYTPNTVLKDADTVTLTNTAGGTYTFKVYPATTVYYEEGFASYTEEWTDKSSKGSGNQATSKVGSQDYYGFDAKYANENTGASNKTAATSTAISDDATFTFTGTGVDIYANCTTSSGSVSIMVKNSDNAIVKLLQVDTSTGVAGSATTGQNVASYSLPIASVSGLTYGTYTVTIRHSKTNADDTGKIVSLDGFRVYDTLDSADDIYDQDNEANPNYLEMRNAVLKGLSVKDVENSGYYTKDELSKAIYDQVLNNSESTASAVVLDNSTSYNTFDVQDLLDNGPKNEVFLRPNQTLAFKLTSNLSNVQIGLKAVSENGANYSITVGNSKVVDGKNLTSSTDMFYKLVESASGETLVTITNNEGGILSVTDLKFFGNVGASTSALMSLEAEDFATVLMCMNYFGDEEVDPEPTEPEETYAEASLTVQVNDATAVLTKKGVVGKTATFTADEIKEAVKALVSDGYKLDDVTYSDVEVAYGESGTVTFTASEEVVEPAPTNIFKQIVNSIVSFFGKIFGRR